MGISWDEFVLGSDDVFESSSLITIPKTGISNTVGINYSNMTGNSRKKEIAWKGYDASSNWY